MTTSAVSITAGVARNENCIIVPRDFRDYIARLHLDIGPVAFDHKIGRDEGGMRHALFLISDLLID